MLRDIQRACLHDTLPQIIAMTVIQFLVKKVLCDIFFWHPFSVN